MISKIIKMAIVAVTLFAFTQPAVAREFGEIYTDCGLGGMIAPTSKGWAVSTNITWDLGTTAISSEISSPGSCMGGQAQTARFINDSYESLERDIARGQGDYLDSLALLVEVSESNKASFINRLRSGFTSYVSNHDYTNQTQFQKSKNLYDIVYN